MRIGVPKEIKVREYRVGLVPAAVRELTAHGHEVYIQKNAGTAIGFPDESFVLAGARIVDSAKEIFALCDLVVKVKEPQPGECELMREGQILFTYLHLAPDPDQARCLLKTGATAIGYETVTEPGGGLPLLAPMSAIAGRMSIHEGAHALAITYGGRGTMLSGAPGVEPAHVTILGGGTVGTNAARIAMSMGADTYVLDNSPKRLRELDDLFAGRVKTISSNRENVEKLVTQSDLVIGAALVPGANAPKLVSEELVTRMLRGAVLVDVSIDQGGCFATSHPTDHEHPTYLKHGVVHYCVANMPGAVARTATIALNNATMPFVIALADKGLGALKANPHFLNGLNIHKGRVTHSAVAQGLGLDFVDPLKML